MRRFIQLYGLSVIMVVVALVLGGVLGIRLFGQSPASTVPAQPAAESPASVSPEPDLRRSGSKIQDFPIRTVTRGVNYPGGGNLVQAGFESSGQIVKGEVIWPAALIRPRRSYDASISAVNYQVFTRGDTALLMNVHGATTMGLRQLSKGWVVCKLETLIAPDTAAAILTDSGVTAKAMAIAPGLAPGAVRVLREYPNTRSGLDPNIHCLVVGGKSPILELK